MDISIIKYTSHEIGISFRNLNDKNRVDVLSIALKCVGNHNRYFFEISGVDVDRFIEDSNCEMYSLITDSEHIFVKNLPKLYMFSKSYDDMVTFAKYAGYFNEGYMTAYVLEKDVDSDFMLLDENQIIHFIKENSVLIVDIASDGEEFSLYSKYKENIELIQEALQS